MSEHKNLVSSSTEQLTMSIRFKERNGKRIMQQLWWIITHHTGQVVQKPTYHGEWRDVPFVGPDVSDREDYP